MERILIVGLGNYPKEYNNTRHNVGFKTIDKLCESFNVELSLSKFNGKYGAFNVGDKTVYIAKPYTLMNLSGEFVQPFMDYFKISPENIIVICDDVDTTFGKMRVRKSGSSGGQNGLKNIINRIGTEDFKRIRIGIGRPKSPMTMIDHVLSKFTKQEQEILDKVTGNAKNLVSEWINGIDFEKLMSKYN